MAENGASEATEPYSSHNSSTTTGSEENTSGDSQDVNIIHDIIINNNQEADTAVTTGQTRFRFYEPQELISEENQKKEDAQKKNRFSFYDDTTRQELAAVENIRKKEQQQQQQRKSAAAVTATSRTEDSTEHILRSLQETEEQRLQILQTDPNPIPTTATASIPLGATPRFSLVGAGGTGDGACAGAVESGSNPYEDAIREALDLLRKHRSPPGTPATDNVYAEGVTATTTTTAGATPPPIMLNVKVPTSGILSSTTVDSIERSRTPRDKDRLLQHRMDRVDNDLGVITVHPGTSAEDEDLPLENHQVGLPLSPYEGELLDAYEEHKLKAKQRQERMAQYASRLQEFKSSLPAETVEQHWPPNLTPIAKDYYQRTMMDAMDEIIPHSGSHDSNAFSEMSHLSQSTKEQVEAEVQRGVERVLLAILDRANASRGRASAQEGVSSNQNTVTSSVGSVVGDALIRAMDELSLKNTNSNGTNSTNTSSQLKTKTSGETQVSAVGSKRSATSVVDELLAEDEDDDILDDDDGDIMGGPDNSLSSPKDHLSVQGRIGLTWGPPKEEKKLPDSQEKTISYGTIEENHEDDVDRLMKECLKASQSEEYAGGVSSSSKNNMHDLGHRKGVLGPLSKRAGGTTGVVLDIDVDVANGVAKHQPENDPSLTSGVYKGPSGDEDSFDRNFKAREDKCSTDEDMHNNDDGTETFEDDSRVGDDDDDDSDFEASELMRTLCAHFLPFGVDQKFKKMIDAIPEWDESNPNEAGYRIIRLSRTQLQRVELAFEKMVNGLKQISEKELGEESGDSKFVSELQEVERLLDESEESHLKVADATKAQKGSLDNSLSISTPAMVAISPDEKQDTSCDEDCHPHFPGVKSTGKGEMGDLEYFHLPIIFKSHVTGFEPTKDLVLEAGNIVAGQYLVESELGSAAFSTAYRCIDLSTESDDGHEEVCLKVIKNTKDFFDQSLDEIKILELLRQTGKVHENHIVEMKCFFYYREHLVIVTELLRQNLFEFGKFIMDNNEEPYFTVTRLAYLTRQALTSLRFVHSLGLVHSDVKPENMLLSSYSRAQIKLIDFGSSCYLTDRQSSYIQSRSYRAPEVVLGLPYDGRIDVWSLGCVVAEMFTGEVTFQNDSIVSMLSRIEAICGPFPRHMIAQGRQSGRFFTNSGLLYEVVDDSENGECNKNPPGPHDDEDGVDYNAKMQFDIFQPKKTRLCTRLGFDPDLMDDFDLETHNTNRVSPARRNQQLFTDFIRRLLTIDPDGRPTADEALNHPWMQYAATLTEEDVKYPS